MYRNINCTFWLSCSTFNNLTLKSLLMLFGAARLSISSSKLLVPIMTAIGLAYTQCFKYDFMY